jgi:type I restriction enzyme S subunit
MGSNWPLKSLKELGVTLIDCVHKTPTAVEKGIPYIGIPQMKNGIIDFSANPRLISEEDYQLWTAKAKPTHGDIVLSRRCNPGETAYVPRGSKFALGQNLVLLRPDSKKIHPGYLRWIVNSPIWWDEVSKYKNPGAVFDSLKCADIPNFEVPEPTYSAQILIDKCLLDISNKIEFNSQINQTLEQMAQALFKSWFVDFDPVIDNALEAGFFEQDLAFPDELLRRAEARKAVREHADFKPLPDTTRQLFPAAFEECAEPSLGLGGWVPKGWKYKTAENIAHVSIGKTPPRKESEWFSERKTNNTTWVSIRDMGVFGSHTGRTSEYLTTEAIEKFNVKKVPKGSILLSFKLTLGRVTIASEELTTNEAIAHFIEPKYGINVPYLYCYLINFNYSSLGSTSSIATAVNSKIIKNMPILVPTESILDCYKKQSEPSFQKMKSLDDETAMLTNLRDTLLPKLISGELRLDQIEADLAKEGVA